jgi:hypothetical protein
MRRSSRLWVAKGLVVAGALAGCGDDDGPSQTCQRDTGESDIAGGVTAAYVAVVTGDANVSAVTYYTDDGPQTLANPVLPFSTTVQLETARARIQATGSPGTGSFQIGYQISDESGPIEQTSVSCP